MSRFPVIRFSKLANFACKRPLYRSVFAKWPGMTSYFLVRFYLKTVKKRNCSGLTVVPTALGPFPLMKLRAITLPPDASLWERHACTIPKN